MLLAFKLYLKLDSARCAKFAAAVFQLSLFVIILKTDSTQCPFVIIVTEASNPKQAIVQMYGSKPLNNSCQIAIFRTPLQKYRTGNPFNNFDTFIFLQDSFMQECVMQRTFYV